MANNASKAGVLDTGRTSTVNGKLIDEWIFHTPFDSMIKHDSSGRFSEWQKRQAQEGWIFKVSIHKSSTNMHFSARCKALGIYSDIEHTDINELKLMCEKSVLDKHEILDGIVWEDWLEVNVSGRSGHNAGDLKVSYSKILRGTNDKFPDSVFTLDSNGLARPFPKPKSELEKQKAPNNDDIWERDEPCTTSYILDTKENRESLDHVIAVLDSARLKLASILNQDVVNENLPKIINNQMLLANKDS